ncbi:hypothetical protein BKA63DRAFT_100275 [Paraphoma chrysanthemicola]|nr:hypothetical protein BKA63DRAFT_100275 [Paraphoma chrysanthemicola]
MTDPYVAELVNFSLPPTQLSNAASFGLDTLSNESSSHLSSATLSPSPRLAILASESPPTAGPPAKSSRLAPSQLVRLIPKTKRLNQEDGRFPGLSQKKYRHVCDVCDASYPHRKNLREHKQTKHLQLRYVCDVVGCGASMAQKKNLARHKAKKHTNGI